MPLYERKKKHYFHAGESYSLNQVVAIAFMYRVYYHLHKSPTAVNIVEEMLSKGFLKNLAVPKETFRSRIVQLINRGLVIERRPVSDTNDTGRAPHEFVPSSKGKNLVKYWVRDMIEGIDPL